MSILLDNALGSGDGYPLQVPPNTGIGQLSIRIVPLNVIYLWASGSGIRRNDKTLPLPPLLRGLSLFLKRNYHKNNLQTNFFPDIFILHN